MKHRKSYFLPASHSSSFSGPLSPTSSSESKIRAAAPDFVELLARSNFSFLHGASRPEEMVLQAKRLGYQGLALCDVNGLYGVVRGFQAAHKPSLFDVSELADADSTVTGTRPGGASGVAKSFHYMCGAELTLYDSPPVVLLPMNKDGYRRLCHLVTKAKRRAPKGQIVVGLKDVLEANDDLLLFPLPPWRDEQLRKMQNAFQDRVYLPVHRDLTWEAVRTYQQALRFEQILGVALFATQRPLFHAPERKPLHDVLTCILHKTTLQEAGTRLTLNSERYLKPREQLAALFRERPDLLERTLEIADRVQFSLRELKYRYPRERLPQNLSASEYLRVLTRQGIAWRYPETKTSPELQARIDRQLDHELKLISEKEYEDYFLTLFDVCQFARKRQILHQGRGSAANSIVCFALGLTSVDPIRLGLLFERFISRERDEPPDIDIDFEHERREEVIQYIYQKYGERHAAMVCTVICYRSRMAVREVAKVLGLSQTTIDAMIKFMGREGLHNLVNNSVDISRFGLSADQFRKLLALAQELQGFPRHLGIHTGGFVISHEPLVDIVPVESATMDQRFVIQWNKDDIDALKMMKVDVLGLGMLSALRRSLDLLRAHKGINWNLAQVPHGDRTTYDMICRADTVGVFQIESRAQMSLLPRLKPRNYYDLVIEVAIVRPGPIQGGMVHPFLRRRSGQEPVRYAHPKLEPILKKTLGIPLFQEQVMQIVSAVAGFTPGESDELRRVMSSAWKRQPVMHGIRQRVINGMLANQIPQVYAEQIYKTIEGFASYGFPESHAASFALLTYVSCYLKCHHPEVFTCALLNSQPMGFYAPRQLVTDAEQHGVKFLPLDVNFSRWDYFLTPGAALAPAADAPSPVNIPSPGAALALRAGFRAVFGLRQAHITRLLDERDKQGVFKSLSDLVRRSRLPKATMLRLAAAGALSTFDLSAREALWAVQSLSFDTESLQFGAHAGLDDARLTQEAEAVPREDAWQEIQREYETKGFAIENHPIAVMRPWLDKHVQFMSARELAELRHRTPVRVMGLRSLIQKPPTAKGMCFVSLEDETGLMNLVLTPDVYAKFRLVLFSSPLLDVAGILENINGVRNIRVTALVPGSFCRSGALQSGTK